MNQPFFSIIIPLYNAQAYISRCLDSCVNQTFKNIEVIIIDDCSKDQSVQIAKEYTLNHPQIHIIHNGKNLGTFLSRIQGIKNAKGEFALFVDADDEIKLDTCSKIYTSIQSDFNHTQQYADIVNFGLEFSPPSKTKIKPKIITDNLFDDQILQTFFLKYSTPPWSLCTKAFKTSILHQAIDTLQGLISPNSPRLTMAEDALFFFTTAMHSKKSIGLNQTLYLYTQNPSSITQRIDTQAIQEKNKSLMHTIDILTQIPTSSTQSLCKKRFVNILKSTIELEGRYANKPFAYPLACIKSLKYHQKWQTYLRITLFLVSFGKIRL